MTIDLDSQHPDRSPISDQPVSLHPEGFTIPQPVGAILTSQSFRNTPFADLPLYLPTLSNPVVGFAGGFNRAALEVSDKGVTCILLPYLNQADGDFIELKLNDVRVDTYFVTKEDAEKANQMVLHVASERFIREAGNALQAFVTRIGGGEDKTNRFNIKADIEAPGGRNPVASTPENENLPKPIFPQDIIDFGVDPEAANRGVPVTIDFFPLNTNLPSTQHRQVRDRIRLSIGGEIVEQRVSEFEAAGTAPITIVVYAGTWDKVGDGVHVCEYEVVDEVGNHSQGFSPPQVIEVRRGTDSEPLLPPAYIDESVERPAPQNALLDVDKLDGKDATVVIDVNRLGYRIGDTLRVKISGRTSEGLSIVTFYEHPIDSTTRAQRIPWFYADILPLINGRIQVTYQRLRSGVPPRNSDSTLVDITGTPVEAGLAAPTVPAANNGTLPADTDPVTVKIKALTGYPANARVILVLNGTYANGTSYYAEHVMRAGSDDIEFHLANGPDGAIAKLATLSLHYTVNGGPPSRRLDLIVGGHRIVLLAPVTDEAVPPDHVFDPTKHRGDLHVTVRTHATFTSGATVTLHAEGSAPGGYVPPIPFEIDANWVGFDLPYVVLRRYLTPNDPGTIKLYYVLTKAGQNDVTSEALTIRVGTPLDLPVPEVLESTRITPTLSRLNPLHVLPPHPDVVTVRVRYRPMLASDDIKMHVIGNPGLGTPDIGIKPGIPAPGGDYVDFTIPNVFVGANLGKNNCKVFYEVIRDHKAQPSTELTLDIQPLAEQEWDLVSVPQANGGVIDISKPHDVRIDAWPFFAQRRNVRIELRGYKAGDAEHNLTLRNNTPVNAQEYSQGFVRNSIPESYLEQLLDTSELTVRAWVSTDGLNSIPPNQELKALHFKVLANATGKPSFTNSPYLLTPQGRVIVQLRLDDASGQPVPNGKLSLTLPNGFNYADGSGGERDFVTDLEGKVTIDVKCSDATGSYTLIAKSGTQFDAAAVNVVANGPDGSTGIDYPTDVALNPEGTRAYVSSYYFSIHVINTVTNTRITTIPLDNQPSDLVISPDGTRLYAAYYEGLYIIDLYDQNVTRLSIGGHTDRSGIAITPDGRTVCLTVTAGALAIIDTATNNISLVSLPANPSGLVITRDGRYAVVGGSELTVIDIQNKAFVKKAFRTAASLAINPNNDSVYICQHGNAQLYIYNLERNEVTDFVQQNHTYNYYMDISHDGERLYLSPGAVYRHLTVVDTVERKQIESKAGADVSRVAISPDNQRMYVTNIRNYTLTSQSAR